MATDFGPQRQRHGVTKNLVEGLGGLVVGAAVVLLAARLLKRRRAADAADDAVTPAGSPATAPQQESDA